ncbi:hypothetical protein [Bacillus sp. FJAT-28004]|nr:hypothetical protein [Bacillus sp. FJAT-28004]
MELLIRKATIDDLKLLSQMNKVLASNPRGQQFWTKCGFEPYYTNMQLKK